MHASQNNSNLMMSDQTGTRVVNMTNPFTGSRVQGYGEQWQYAQPFEQYQDNSYTYTLQHPLHEQHMQYQPGNDSSSYDEEADSSETSSEC